MSYLLDTNSVIALLKGDAAAWEKLDAQSPDDCAISAIVAYELFYGAFKSQRRDENLARIDGLRFEVIDFDQNDARHAGEIRATLEAAGTPIGSNDILIAGQARSRDLTLVTRNVREFERVPDLKMERW